LQPSTIEAQSALGASLLSQTLRLASINLPLANALKEPITSKSADASSKPHTAKEENPSDSPLDVTKVSA
jgi:hypothetical protein